MTDWIKKFVHFHVSMTTSSDRKLFFKLLTTDTATVQSLPQFRQNIPLFSLFLKIETSFPNQ